MSWGDTFTLLHPPLRRCCFAPSDAPLLPPRPSVTSTEGAAMGAGYLPPAPQAPRRGTPATQTHTRYLFSSTWAALSLKQLAIIHCP